MERVVFPVVVGGSLQWVVEVGRGRGDGRVVCRGESADPQEVDWCIRRCL